MKFGDLQNRIDDAIRTGVIEDNPTMDSFTTLPTQTLAQTPSSMIC